MEHKVYILTMNNKVFGYTCDVDMDVQNLINVFRKIERLPIAEVYTQPAPNAPMELVTGKYNIEFK